MVSMTTAIQQAMAMKERGELDCGLNVMVVRLMGVRIVSGKIPAAVRKELNEAVKAGKLGRIAKNGLEPEAYFHPNARTTALELRAKEARQSIEVIKHVCI